MRVEFDKMEGAGNDFVLVDNRDDLLTSHEKQEFVIKYSPRALGIGADGVIFIEKDLELDFSWDFYNSDGSKAEMCGNGARCAARYAYKIGAASKEMTFRTLAGPIKAYINSDEGAKIQLTNATLPQEIKSLSANGKIFDLWSINTGVPHIVVPVLELDSINVKELGKVLRYHEKFQPKGTNVNFMQKVKDNVVKLRTYERGVEDETLACGTGCTAAAIISSIIYGFKSPVEVITKSGLILTVSFVTKNNSIHDVFLSGAAKHVFSGWVDL